MYYRSIKKWIYIGIIWFVGLYSTAVLWGQPNYRFESLSYKEGLECNWYFHIIEDSMGFLWFAGHTGLTRYDGRMGKHYRSDVNKEESLADDQVFRLMQSSNGNIWCSTLGGGVSILDPIKGTFQNLNTANGKWPTDNVGEIIQHTDSIFYFLGGRDKNLYKASKKEKSFQFKEFPLEYDHRGTPTRDNKARYLLKDRRDPGIFWIIGNCSIYKFDTYQDSLYLFHTFEILLDGAIGFDLIPAVEWIDEDHLMLYLINHGFHMFSLRDTSSSLLYFDREKLPHHCRYIKKLQNGAYIWAYSDGSLFTYQYPDQQPIELPIAYPQTRYPWLEYVYEAQNGDLYIAGNGNGIMLVKAAYHTIQWIEREELKLNFANQFSKATITKNGNKLLYSKRQVDSLFIIDTKTRKSNWVKGSNIPEIWRGNSIETLKDQIYTHNGKAIYRVNLSINDCENVPLEQLSRKVNLGGYIKKLEIDHEGLLWVYGNHFLSAYKNGKIVRDIHLHSFDKIAFTDYKYAVKLGDKVLFFVNTSEIFQLDLAAEKLSLVHTDLPYLTYLYNQPMVYEDAIYIPSHFHGIIQAKLFGDSLQLKDVIRANDFLLSNNVYSLNVAEDYIWISTGVGLQRWHPKSGKIFNIDHRYNLPELYLDRPLQIQTSGWFSLPITGYLYFGNMQEVIPQQLKIHSNIISIRVNNEERLEGILFETNEDLTLSPMEKNLSLGWSIRSDQSQNAYQVAYQLKGFDDDWVLLNQWEDLQANYTNLAPGRYTFKVKIVPNIDLEDFNIISLNISVQAPYWQRWWFRILIAGLIALIGYSAYKWRTNTIRQQEFLKNEYNKRISEIQWQSLETQMNPHFMFNSLNAIKRLMLKGNEMQASDYLSRFSQMLRQVLNLSKQSKIRLADELGILKIYSDLELMRFNHSFNYKIYIDEHIETSQIMVPSLFLQPFVEDAIWQAKSSKSEDARVEIIISTIGDFLSIIIQDNRDLSTMEKGDSDQKKTTGRILQVKDRLSFAHPEVSIKTIVDADATQQVTHKLQILIPHKNSKP